MVQQCRRDRLFPAAGMQAAIDRLGAIFTKANVANQFAGRFFDVPRIFNREMQDDAFALLHQKLNHQPR